MSTLISDLRYAVRGLARTPGFVCIIVLTLATGIAAVSAAFSVANWWVLAPMPGIRNPRDVRLVRSVAEPCSDAPLQVWLSYPAFREIDAASRTVTLGGVRRGGVSVAAEGREEWEVGAEFVTASYFGVLGVRTRVGRPFGEADDVAGGAPDVAVISEWLWQRLFDRDPAVLERSLRINGRPARIVGVTAGDFGGTTRLIATDIWLPAASETRPLDSRAARGDGRPRGFDWLVARIEPAFTWAQAQTELHAWPLPAVNIDGAERADAARLRIGPGPGFDASGASAGIPFLFVLGGIVLLVACVNAATLLLIRHLGRRAEFATRRALGASTGRLVASALVEGVLLWLVAAVVALPLVMTLMQVVNSTLLAWSASRLTALSLDWRVVLFTMTLSLAVGVLSCVLPAVSASRVALVSVLRGADVTATPPRNVWGPALTVVQLAASFALIVPALLLAATTRHVANEPLGFEPDRLTALSVPTGRLDVSADAVTSYVRELEQRLLGRPAAIESVQSRSPWLTAADRGQTSSVSPMT